MLPEFDHQVSLTLSAGQTACSKASSEGKAASPLRAAQRCAKPKQSKVWVFFESADIAICGIYSRPFILSEPNNILFVLCVSVGTDMLSKKIEDMGPK